MPGYSIIAVNKLFYIVSAKRKGQLVIMNKEKFRSYFLSKAAASSSNASAGNQNDEVSITGVFSSATNIATPADISMAEDELAKSVRPVKYETKVKPMLQREIARYAKTFGATAAMKHFQSKHPKLKFSRTTIIGWVKKLDGNGEIHIKGTGRPNLLGDNLLKKIKDIIVGTRIAGGVINRRTVLCIANGVVRANKPNLLKEFGGTLELTDRWASYLLSKTMRWVKRKGTTGKVAPPPLLLKEEKFSFQRDIAQAVYDHKIPKRLVFNLDQTPLNYISPGKYSFAPGGSKHVPIKGVDDKRQITATFAVNAAGEFFPMQLIYQGKTKRCLPKHSFPEGFNVTMTKNHWSNTEKAEEYFKVTLFPIIKKIKQEEGLSSEQKSLMILDNFKGQDNDQVKNLLQVNKCLSRVVPHNMTSWFQPLDVSVNKPSKSFMSRKFNDWLASEISAELLKGVDPAYIKVSTTLIRLKSLHAKWIEQLYVYLKSQSDIIINGFQHTGIMEAIENAEKFASNEENPFRE